MSTRQSHPSANRMARQYLSRGFQRSAIALAIAALLSASAYAQDADPAGDAEEDKAAIELDTMVVTVVRRSVTNAQQIKQNAERIVDSIAGVDQDPPTFTATATSTAATTWMAPVLVDFNTSLATRYAVTSF